MAKTARVERAEYRPGESDGIPGWRGGEPVILRYTRAHGEQPEPQTVSSIGGCKWCERVPCEDFVHALWRDQRNGSDA